MVHVQQLGISFGVSPVLDDVSFVIHPGEHVGLIGPNGSGKTTLVRCVLGELSADRGTITVGRVGYLPQSFTAIEQQTLGAAALGSPALIAAEDDLIAAADALAAGGSDDAYAAALERFESLGGYDRQVRAAAALDQLGLGDLDSDTPVASLSGGQKTRLGLAALLVDSPETLILDEPTNHLDSTGLRWLEGFVRSFPGAVLVISHDRAFLDAVTTRILAIDPRIHSIASYPGNYSAFRLAKAAERAAQEEAYTRQEEYVRQVRADIDRLKSSARSIELSTTPRTPGLRVHARKKATLAKARERKLDRYLASDDRVEKPPLDWGLKLDFGTPPGGGQAVLTLDSVSAGYGDQLVLRGLSLTVRAGDRVAITGPNGSGKTTLLRLIAGDLTPVRGSVRLGSGVRVGVLRQEQETLDPDATVLATALAELPMSETEARSFLHFFLFSGDAVFRPVGACSLGERARLQLALLVLRGCTLLLLDEPLNHLDIDGREHFEAALDAYDGTILAVSHDRAFVERFAEWTIVMRNE